MQNPDRSALGSRQLVLNEDVTEIVIDLRRERLIQVIGTDKNNNPHPYILKVTAKGGLALS